MCARIGLSQLRSFGDYKLKGYIRKNFFVTKKGEKFIIEQIEHCPIALLISPLSIASTNFGELDALNPPPPSKT